VIDGDRRNDDGLGTHFNDLFSLVVAYAKQETVEPIQNLGRYIAWGVAGAILLAAGVALLTLTVVRIIQSETGTHLHGNLTWVPYLGGVLVALLGLLWALYRVLRGDRVLKERR
jgi:cytochrome c biogenesis protein CcdA